MSRTVVTAKLLDELLKAGAEIRLPKDALVTPAARDWLRDHRVPVTWDGPSRDGAAKTLAVVMDPSTAEMRAIRAMLDRMGGLVDVIEPAGGRSGIPAATRRLCGKIARREVAKGVVFAQDGAVPVCVANKHNGVRAALAMNVPMVEEACRELGVNLLVIELPGQSTWSMRQMIERLLKGPTAPRPELVATLESIEQGGGRADW